MPQERKKDPIGELAIPVIRPRIAVGYRVGRLIVISSTGQRKNGYMVWRCHCDCGGERLLDTRTLQRGTIGDCGCITKIPPGAKDLTGRRFGKLEAVSPTEKRASGGIVWRCRCDCGNETETSSHQLVSGNTKSCGCLGHPPLKDFVGNRFGQLTVVAYEGKRDGMHRWRCKCDCGNETVVGQTLLQSGKTRSCGCRKTDAIRENLKLVEGTSVLKLEKAKNGLMRSNTSGYNGVYLDKKTGRWKAQITFKGKTYYLGTYDKIEEAVKARKRGEELHEDFLDWYYTEYLPAKERSQMGKTV